MATSYNHINWIEIPKPCYTCICASPITKECRIMSTQKGLIQGIIIGSNNYRCEDAIKSKKINVEI